jgi:hypothetical protein
MGSLRMGMEELGWAKGEIEKANIYNGRPGNK